VVELGDVFVVELEVDIATFGDDAGLVVGFTLPGLTGGRLVGRRALEAAPGGLIQRFSPIDAPVNLAFRTSRSAFGPPPLSGHDRVDRGGLELFYEVA
jgi:hypothetical protein